MLGLITRARYALAVVLVLPMAGCMSVQALEPVQSPPVYLRHDAQVAIEFLAPPMVGLRCAQRGVKFAGLPGINSGACATRDLVSLPDPCLTLTAGVWAETLCAQANAITRNASVHSATNNGPRARVIKASYPAAPQRIDSATPAMRRPTSASTDSTLDQKAVRFEFVSAGEIEYRCAERGAKFVQAGDFSTRTCADRMLVTMINPCTAGSGWYLKMVCHELGHVNGWASDHSNTLALLPLSQSPLAIAVRLREENAARLAALEAGRTDVQANVDTSPSTDTVLAGSPANTADDVASPSHVSQIGWSQLFPFAPLHQFSSDAGQRDLLGKCLQDPTEIVARR